MDGRRKQVDTYVTSRGCFDNLKHGQQLNVGDTTKVAIVVRVVTCQNHALIEELHTLHYFCYTNFLLFESIPFNSTIQVAGLALDYTYFQHAKATAETLQ